MLNKILNQLYHSCNTSNALQKHKFLKALTLWSSYYIWSQHGLLCAFWKISVFATHSSKNLDSDCPISATLSQAWGNAAGGDSSGSGMLQSAVNPSGCSISSWVFGQLFLLTPIFMAPRGCGSWIHFPRCNLAFAFCTSCLTSSRLWRRLVASP